MEEFSIDTLMLLHDIPSSWTKKHWELFFFLVFALFDLINYLPDMASTRNLQYWTTVLNHWTERQYWTTSTEPLPRYLAAVVWLIG